MLVKPHFLCTFLRKSFHILRNFVNFALKKAKVMEFQTTFMEDFRIANMFGIDAVKDTFDRAFNEWKDNVVYGTELCIVMNIYCWHFCDTNPQLSELYADYYYKVRDYCLDNYKGDDWQYFWHKIDLYYGDYSFIPS